MGVWFMAPENNCNRNSRARWSQAKNNNNEKVWNIVRTTKIWHSDLKWANVVVKTVPINLVWSRVATYLQFV